MKCQRFFSITNVWRFYLKENRDHVEIDMWCFLKGNGQFLCIFFLFFSVCCQTLKSFWYVAKVKEFRYVERVTFPFSRLSLLRPCILDFIVVTSQLFKNGVRIFIVYLTTFITKTFIAVIKKKKKNTKFFCRLTRIIEFRRTRVQILHKLSTTI